MVSNDSMPQQGDATYPPLPLPSSPSSSFSENWKECIFIPTLLAGIVGGGVGLVSEHREVHGLANISASYATNFAIVTGCYCGNFIFFRLSHCMISSPGALEYVRVTQKSEPDNLINSAVAGFGTGALLARLQVDFATIS